MINVLKKVIVLFVLCCFCVGMLASCGEFSTEKKTVEKFFAYIAAGKYEDAESLIHPKRELGSKTYFNGLEEKGNIDFQKGIKIEKYISIDYTEYDREYMGSVCVLTIRTRVSGKVVRFEVTIIDNIYGYGIYNLKTVK